MTTTYRTAAAGEFAAILETRFADVLHQHSIQYGVCDCGAAVDTPAEYAEHMVQRLRDAVIGDAHVDHIDEENPLTGHPVRTYRVHSRGWPIP